MGGTKKKRTMSGATTTMTEGGDMTASFAKYAEYLNDLVILIRVFLLERRRFLFLLF